MPGSTLDAAPVPAKLRTGSLKERGPAQIHMAGKQQLASEIIGLIRDLDAKLECYVAVQSESPVAESSHRLNDSAVAWIQQTMEDVAATVVGLEAAFTMPTPEHLNP